MNWSEQNKNQRVAKLLLFNLVYNVWWQILFAASDNAFNEAHKISLKVGLEKVLQRNDEYS